MRHTYRIILRSDNFRRHRASKHTPMHLAEEYSGCGVSRKALRVTTPQGQQRAIYWLQLPFKYSIPLIATSATLHWLISQALFLIRIDPQVGPQGNDDSWTSVRSSPAPMVGIICVGGCVAVLAIALGQKSSTAMRCPSLRVVPKRLPLWHTDRQEMTMLLC